MKSSTFGTFMPLAKFSADLPYSPGSIYTLKRRHKFWWLKREGRVLWVDPRGLSEWLVKRGSNKSALRIQEIAASAGGNDVL